MITAAADGSSLSNPGPAGWAWYIDDDHWAAGGWQHGTNNMGELMAVLDLLRQTASVPDEPLRVLCDSQYVINSLTKWMPGWKRKGWRKGDGKPVLNVELFKELDRELAGRDVSFEWVKGHAGHAMNEAADARARAAATAFQQGRPVVSGPGFDGSGHSPAAAPVTGPSVIEEPPSLFDEAPSDAEEVAALEQALLRDDVRADRERVAALLHPDFVEFGASGRVWTRGRMLAEIAPLSAPVIFELVAADQVSPDAVLLTWRQDDRVLRSSLWLRTSDGWRLRFHQGTPAG